MDGGGRRQSQHGPNQRFSESRLAQSQDMSQASQAYSHAASSSSAVQMVPPPVQQYVSQYQYGVPGHFDGQTMHEAHHMPGMHMQQFSPSYSQDASRSSQHTQPVHSQQYMTYSQSPMLQNVASQSTYQSLPPYQQQQQRQSTAIEVLAGQFGSLPSYMQAADGNTMTSNPGNMSYMQYHAESPSFDSVSMSRPQLQPPFVPVMTDFTAVDHNSSQAQPGMHSQQTLDQELRAYEQNMGSVYAMIRAGRLTDAADPLMLATRWLLNSVRFLGLHHDDESKHAQRVTFWKDFNHAWEALGQKQKDMSSQRRGPQGRSQQLLSPAKMNEMIHELVKLADSVEKYGLVDYELGVWEEQIDRLEDTETDESLEFNIL